MRWVNSTSAVKKNIRVGNNGSISFQRGMFNGSHESMNVFKLSNTSTDNFQFEWHAAEMETHQIAISL